MNTPEQPIAALRDRLASVRRELVEQVAAAPDTATSFAYLLANLQGAIAAVEAVQAEAEQELCP